jgi:hypothetical protein
MLDLTSSISDLSFNALYTISANIFLFMGIALTNTLFFITVLFTPLILIIKGPKNLLNFIKKPIPTFTVAFSFIPTSILIKYLAYIQSKSNKEMTVNNDYLEVITKDTWTLISDILLKLYSIKLIQISLILFILSILISVGYNIYLKNHKK